MFLRQLQTRSRPILGYLVVASSGKKPASTEISLNPENSSSALEQDISRKNEWRHSLIKSFTHASLGPHGRVTVTRLSEDLHGSIALILDPAASLWVHSVGDSDTSPGGPACIDGMDP